MTASARAGRLSLRRLSKRYPGTVAVDAIDLDVASGEFVTLLGPSGSGKTTTLMMIAGFTTPSGGEITIDEAPITGKAPEHRNIGVVFQNYALFPHMSVFHNVAFPLRMRQVDKADIRARVGAALDLVRLTGLSERMPAQLSGGQQQRVALARALVFNPGIMLMDEPLGALDKNLREQMKYEIMRIHRELAVTVIYVTHDQEEALTMSDRVALMNLGRIAQLGTAADLYERPCNRFVAEFIGESNVIEGKFEPCVDEREAVLIDEQGRGFRAALGEWRPSAGERCALVLRPEKIALSAANGDPGGHAGTVEEAVYVGEFTRYQVRLDARTVLTAKAANRDGLFRAGRGERVSVDWAARDAYLVPAAEEDHNSKSATPTTSGGEGR